MTTTTTRSTHAAAVLDAFARLRLIGIAQAFLEAEVQASKGEPYRVRIGPGRRWCCSCPSAVYGGRRAEPCKHAVALRLLARALPDPLRGDWT